MKDGCARMISAIVRGVVCGVVLLITALVCAAHHLDAGKYRDAEIWRDIKGEKNGKLARTTSATGETIIHG